MKKIILPILVFIIIVLGYLYINNKKNSSYVPHEVEDIVIQKDIKEPKLIEKKKSQLAEGSFITKTSDPNINIFTSPRLGIKLKYAVIDPLSNLENRIIEEGRAVKVTDSQTATINDEYNGLVQVFEKDSNISLEKAIHNDFGKESCDIEIVELDDNQGLDIKARFVYPEDRYGDGGRVDITQLSDVGPSSDLDKQCAQSEPKIDYPYNNFRASSQVKDKYITISLSNQSVEAVLKRDEDGHLEQWPYTVEFLK